MNHFGSRATNTATTTDDDEREYDRLRGLASASAAERDSCLKESKIAYKYGKGATARILSNRGKKHKREMERYNAAACDWIFRANNAAQPSDTIDLHRLFVGEAEGKLAARINSSMASGEAGLHVIVGRGNHSANGVRKLAPAVQRLCTERGLKFREEQNEGRIYVWLRRGTGGQGITPPGWGSHQQHDGPHQSHQQPQLHQQQLHRQQLHRQQLHQKQLHQQRLHQQRLHQQQPHQQQPHQQQFYQQQPHQQQFYQQQPHQQQFYQQQFYQQQHQPDLLEETAENIFPRIAKYCIIVILALCIFWLFFGVYL